VYGFVGQTEALVARMRSEMGVEAPVVATGGLADVIARHTTVVADVNPHLSLLGLRKYYLATHAIKA
jgi:type III pantothenate kinase